MSTWLVLRIHVIRSQQPVWKLVPEKRRDVMLCAAQWRANVVGLAFFTADIADVVGGQFCHRSNRHVLRDSQQQRT